MPIIYLETRIFAPIETVFDLARSVDIHKSSAAATNERVIEGKTSGLLEIGETVTWRAKHLGFYQNLTVEITQFEKPYMFVDTMLKGAFSSMKHLHKFEKENDGTKMTDIFEFESPLGAIGQLFNFLFLKSYMKRFLVTRNEILKTAAETYR